MVRRLRQYDSTSPEINAPHTDSPAIRLRRRRTNITIPRAISLLPHVLLRRPSLHLPRLHIHRRRLILRPILRPQSLLQHPQRQNAPRRRSQSLCHQRLLRANRYQSPRSMHLRRRGAG